MKHFISKDMYFSFKEYPNKGNVINSISGIYANNGQITETLIKTTSMVEFPKTENALSTKNKNRYNFPKTVLIELTETLPLDDYSKYNGGFKYEIFVLRARNKRNAKNYSSDNLEYWYDIQNDQYSSDSSNITDSSYYLLTSGYAKISGNSLNISLTFNDYINVQRYSGFINQDGIGIHNIYKNEAVTYYEPTIFGTPYYVQNFLYGYIIKIYGISSSIEFVDKFNFSDSSNSTKFNIELGQNELLTENSQYKDVGLANNIANRIFENYKNGRPTAELEWIGNPEVRVGDIVVIDNGIEYFVCGKKINFNGGYSEKLYLIKYNQFYFSVNITTQGNITNYGIYSDGEKITGETILSKYSKILIDMRESGAKGVTIKDAKTGEVYQYIYLPVIGIGYVPYEYFITNDIIIDLKTTGGVIG